MPLQTAWPISAEAGAGLCWSAAPRSGDEIVGVDLEQIIFDIFGGDPVAPFILSFELGQP